MNKRRITSIGNSRAYLLFYPLESIFQIFLLEIIAFFKVLAETTRGPVNLELFRPYTALCNSFYFCFWPRRNVKGKYIS